MHVYLCMCVIKFLHFKRNEWQGFLVVWELFSTLCPDPHSILELFFHVVNVNISPSIEWQRRLVTLRWRQQFNGNRSTQITLVMKVPHSIHSYSVCSQDWLFSETCSQEGMLASSSLPMLLCEGDHLSTLRKPVLSSMWKALSFSQQTMIILAFVSQNIPSAFYGKALLFCQKPIWMDSFPRIPWSTSVTATSCPTPGIHIVTHYQGSPATNATSPFLHCLIQTAENSFPVPSKCLTDSKSLAGVSSSPNTWM